MLFDWPDRASQLADKHLLCPFVIGGFVGEWAGVRHSGSSGRLHLRQVVCRTTRGPDIPPGCQLSRCHGPTGVLAVGWALHAEAHLAIGAESFSCSVYLPALFSYGTTIKESASAAASGGIQSMMVFASALIVMVGSIAAPKLGYGWWFTVLACIQGLANIFAHVMIVSKQRAARGAAAALPIPAATVLIDGP